MPKTKIKNQKNKDQIWHLNKLVNNYKFLHDQCNFRGQEREN